VVTTFLRFHFARLKRVQRRQWITKKNLRKAGLQQHNSNFTLQNPHFLISGLPDSSSASDSDASMDTDSSSSSPSSQSSRSSSTSDSESESDDISDSDYFHKAMEDLDSWMSDLEAEISIACLNEDMFGSSSDSEESNSDTDNSDTSDEDPIS